MFVKFLIILNINQRQSSVIIRLVLLSQKQKSHGSRLITGIIVLQITYQMHTHICVSISTLAFSSYDVAQSVSFCKGRSFENMQ